MGQWWIMYDVHKGEMSYVHMDYVPTEQDLKNDIIKLPYHQAYAIRKAKELPMPVYPVAVNALDME